MGRYYHLGTLLMAKLDAAHEDTEEAPILDEVSALLKQVSVGTPCRPYPDSIRARHRSDAISQSFN